jgi:hypothetical protein
VSASPAAGFVNAFEHHDTAGAARGQVGRGGEAGGSRADDEDVHGPLGAAHRRPSSNSARTAGPQ